MSLIATIAKLGGPAVVKQVAKQFGLNNGTASKAIGMILPSLAGGLKRNILKGDGLSNLVAELSGGEHFKYVDDPEALASAETTTDGNGILGHVLKNKDASRAVASTVAGSLGIDEAIVKKMLPQVAAVAMGGLAKQSHAAGLHDGGADSSEDELRTQLENMLEVSDASDMLGKLMQ